MDLRGGCRGEEGAGSFWGVGASGDDGKRLGACGKRLRVALHSTKWILEGGAGGRTGPRAFSNFAPREIFFVMLGRLGRLRAA